MTSWWGYVISTVPQFSKICYTVPTTGLSNYAFWSHREKQVDAIVQTTAFQGYEGNDYIFSSGLPNLVPQPLFKGLDFQDLSPSRLLYICSGLSLWPVESLAQNWMQSTTDGTLRANETILLFHTSVMWAEEPVPFPGTTLYLVRKLPSQRVERQRLDKRQAALPAWILGF